MTLETIVRPFQTNDVSPGKTAIDTGFSNSNAPVHLQLGKDGWPPKVLQASYSASITNYVIRRPVENYPNNASNPPGQSWNPDYAGTNTNIGGSINVGSAPSDSSDVAIG